MCFCSGGVSPAAAHDLQADRLRAGERDRVHARVAHERGADVALAGQQRQRVGRHAGLAQRPHEHERAAGRLLGRLEHHGVAGRERRRGHPAAGSRPGSSTARSPRRRRAGASAIVLRSPGTCSTRRRACRAGRRVRLERDRAARVVLEEVDRLADVGVGLAPRLRALAHLERGDLEPALAQPLRRARSAPRRARRPGARPTRARRAGRRRAPRRPRPRWPPPSARPRARARPDRSRPAPRPRAGRAPTQRARAAAPARRARAARRRAARGPARGAAPGSARWRRAPGSETSPGRRSRPGRAPATAAPTRAGAPAAPRAARRAPARAGTSRCEVFSSSRRTR